MDLEQLLLRVSMDTISGVWILQGDNYRFAFVADHDDLSRSAGQSLVYFKTIDVGKSFDLVRSCPIHLRQLFARYQALIVEASLPHQRNSSLISDSTEFSLQFQNFIR